MVQLTRQCGSIGLMAFGLALGSVLAGVGSASATDYFVTIGGGYNPAGNQASLEANVLFFQRILREQHPQPNVVETFFADGDDQGADLQVEAHDDRPVRPVTELITTLHRRGPPGGATAGAWIKYRNHEVPNVAGALNPQRIRKSLDQIARKAKTGDRLIVYVTAHGDEAPEGKDPYNTSISCWNESSISMKELSGWLDEIPPEVPVVMVMAQCYCGGFTHTIFEGADSEKGLAKHRRIGFFAQQHDLPAAGCRPDIKNDAEYSSYFWGAFIGQTRSGKPMPGCDADGNGVVSFDEAHAQAIIASETIDIPLKASDVLLRQYSRIPDYTRPVRRERNFGRGQPNETETPPETAKPDASVQAPAAAPEKSPIPGKPLHSMHGTIQNLLSTTIPATQRTVKELCRQLEIPLTGDVSDAVEAYRLHLNQNPFAGSGGPFARGPGSGGRRNNGRRALLDEIGTKWPDLADPEKWSRSELLKTDDQKALFEEIQQLPSYAAYKKRVDDREKQAEDAETHELRGVKYRRLLETFETIALARNLPQLATPEVVAGYERMQELERMSLQPQ